jgi:hypothetical protein
MMQNPLQGFVDQFRPGLRNAAEGCTLFARAVLERLDDIRDGVTDDTRRRSNVLPLVYTGAQTKDIEVPIGEGWMLSLLAVSAAATITIRSGGTLRYIKTFAGADTIGPDALITAGPGTPLQVTSSGAAEVTMHITVVEREDTRPTRGAGDTEGVGLSRDTGVAIGRHFAAAGALPGGTE